jgi:hypothetical protein
VEEGAVREARLHDGEEVRPGHAKEEHDREDHLLLQARDLCMEHCERWCEVRHLRGVNYGVSYDVSDGVSDGVGEGVNGRRPCPE